MSLHYRNKTIFDWNTFKGNDISSTISLSLMTFLKQKFNTFDFHNIIIRDVDKMIGIIIQLNNTFIDEIQKEEISNITNTYIEFAGYELKFFAIQSFDKNMTVYKNDFIKFKAYYFNPVIISLLPNSFYQPNIKMLKLYYEHFSRWIELSKCKNMINLGDDGGNICTILNKSFKNMITFFHCKQSYKCAEEMIKDNNIKNLSLTFDINDCIQFDIFNKDIILFIDPGRKGLKDYEIHFIKNCKNIKNIIYLACNYNTFTKNKTKLDQYEIIDQVELNVMPLTDKTQNLIYMNLIT